jgi:hypothetical protein
MKLILFMMLFFPVISLADWNYFIDDLVSNEPLNKTYLKDFPGHNDENLRMLLPVKYWPYSEFASFKGSFLKFKVSSDDMNEDTFDASNLKLNIYSKTDLSKNNLKFRIDKTSIFKGSSKICEWKEYKTGKMADRFYRCGSGYCKFDDSETRELENFKYLKDNFFKSTNGQISSEKCDSVKLFRHPNSAIGIRTFGIAIKSLHDEYAILEIDGADHFLDTRFCKTKSSNCELVKQEVTPLEFAWITKSSISNKKNYDQLNYLITNLLPCVKSNNLKCVEGFIITPEWTDNEGTIFAQPTKVLVNNELLKDLEVCLNYSNLLPFGNRTLSRNGKICLFSIDPNLGDKKYKIHGVTLPDAFKTIREESLVNYNL